MKLPFDLGVKLFFRLLIPGFCASLGLLPLLLSLWEHVGWRISVEYTLLLSITVMGWLIISFDVPIYMIFEGRRGWPDFLREWYRQLEQDRLERISWTQNTYIQADRQKYLEASVEKRKFPFNQEGQYQALLPTRLGNAMTAYETYPDTRYGMDAVFYWYRIWLTLDKDLKEDIDNRAALADSAVYSSLALYLSSLLWLVYSILPTLRVVAFKYAPGGLVSWGIFLFLLFSAYGVYRVSVTLHSQYGEFFKSLFDVYGSKVDVSSIVEEVANITNDSSLLQNSRRQYLQTAWRYLHNYRVKCPLCGVSLLVLEVERHNSNVHGTIAELASATSAEQTVPADVSQVLPEESTSVHRD
jgi:hypothetical protein